MPPSRSLIDNFFCHASAILRQSAGDNAAFDYGSEIFQIVAAKVVFAAPPAKCLQLSPQEDGAVISLIAAPL